MGGITMSKHWLDDVMDSQKAYYNGLIGEGELYGEVFKSLAGETDRRRKSTEEDIIEGEIE
jgi:hypothetical protein